MARRYLLHTHYRPYFIISFLGSILLIGLLCVLPTHADTSFTVHSILDTQDHAPGDGTCADSAGNCTLRAAIQEANALEGTDTIMFALPGNGPQTIAVTSALPGISGTVIIDGVTQAGATCGTATEPAHLQIELSGTGITANGLTLLAGSDGSLIQGLVINGFGDNGILIQSTNNIIACNHIGTDITGNQDRGNGANGIFIDNVPNNRIGGATPGERNVISGNGGNGVAIGIVEEEAVVRADAPASEPLPPPNALRNQVLGNYIGTNAAGVVDLGNTLNGVMLAAASNNLIGGDAAHSGNLIAGNDQNGVALVEGASANLIQRNAIGVNAVGAWPLGNTLQGVAIENAADNVIQNNLISGNTEKGILISDPPSSIASTGNQILGNIIGLNLSGNAIIPNGLGGVGIQNASANIVGGAAVGQRNVISGNNGDAIIVQRSSGSNFVATGNQIIGNFLGTDIAGTTPLGNTGAGVNLFQADNTLVQANVIGGNSAGMIFNGTYAVNNRVFGNFIGVGVDGTTPLGNGEHGVFLHARAHNNQIGGVNPGEANIIAHHNGRGVWITGAEGTVGNAIRGNSMLANDRADEHKLGIDLAPNDVNPNDPYDVDRGPNSGQNFPELVGAYAFDAKTILNGTLMSLPNTTFAIDIFSNTACDPLGHGEGETYLQTVTITTDTYGVGGFALVLEQTVPAERFLTVNATSPEGDSSEFSNCVGIVPAYVVNATDDDNGDCTIEHCSLRAAMQAANTHAGQDTIVFAIAGAGPHTITPAQPLPTLTEQVIIDGLSQPGAFCPATVAMPPINPVDHAADLARLLNPPSLTAASQEEEEELPDIPRFLRIELNGSNLPDASGLSVAGGDSTIRGLVINRFGGSGIELTGQGGNHLACNVIGADVTGTTKQANGQHGIFINNSPGNNIGTIVPDAGLTSEGAALLADPSERNLIAGNSGAGIQIEGSQAANNRIMGNYIGLDASGTLPLGNGGHGVSIQDAPGTAIGATVTDTVNLISGNGGSGVLVTGSSAIITGNFIGVDRHGTSAIGNAADGITIIGGNNQITQNVLSGNAAAGIALQEGSSANQVTGNYIGTDIWRQSSLRNGAQGVLITGSDNLVNRNVIVYNDRAGIQVRSSAAVRNRLTANVLSGNTGLGIELGDDGNGVTFNDAPGDDDTGPNMLQNYPVLDTVTTSQEETSITGSLSSSANTSYTLEFFVNLTCDTTGHGEGRTLIGSESVTTDGNGTAQFTFTFNTVLPANAFVTATATDTDGNTSEFSACAPPPEPFAAVALIPQIPGYNGYATEIVTYVLELTNQGNKIAYFDIAVDSNWPAEYSTTRIGPLAPGASHAVIVKITIPDADIGASDIATITASAVNADVSATAQVTTTITQTRPIAALALTLPTTSISGKPGETVQYNATVTNQGTRPDSFTLAADGNWTAILSADQTAELAPGANSSFTVAVTIPANADDNASNTTTLLVTSQNDANVHETITLTTTARRVAESFSGKLFLPIIRR